MARSSAFSSSLLAAALAGAGCTPPDGVVKLFNDKLAPLIGVRLTRLTGQAPAKDASSASDVAPNSGNRRVNGEFIREFFQAVLQREVKNEEEFSRYMNPLDQGGHYEAIYNGIVYSREFRDKEAGVSPVKALRTYTEVMAQILLDQKYDPLRIAKADKPDVPVPDSDVKPPQPTEAERAGLMAELESDALTKPFFTLKRRLGEEVLKTIELKKEYKEKLATWYGRFTVFLNKKGVDFGFEQRNRPDEYYHYRWALDAEEDRLKWECLNRLHQLMNAQAK